MRCHFCIDILSALMHFSPSWITLSSISLPRPILFTLLSHSDLRLLVLVECSVVTQSPNSFYSDEMNISQNSGGPLHHVVHTNFHSIVNWRLKKCPLVLFKWKCDQFISHKGEPDQSNYPQFSGLIVSSFRVLEDWAIDTLISCIINTQFVLVLHSPHIHPTHASWNHRSTKSK